MIKKIIKLKYILILGIAIISSFFLLILKIHDCTKKLNTHESKKQKLEEINNILSYNMMEQMYSTGSSIGNPSVIFKENKDKIRFMADLKFKSLLVIRVSPLSCSMCVDSTLTQLNNFFLKNKDFRDKVAIMTSYRRERDLRLFLRLQQIHNDIKIFNIVEDEITLPIEIEKKPYMFVLNSNLVSKSVFIPEKRNPELTDLYLRYIKRKYFDKL